MTEQICVKYKPLFMLTVSGMPPTEEFAVCFQKIKCGFNLLVSRICRRRIGRQRHRRSFMTFICVCDVTVLMLCGVEKMFLFFLFQGELDGRINNPSAPEFVHALFSILAFVSLDQDVQFFLSYLNSVSSCVEVGGERGVKL